MVVSLAWN